MLPLWHSAKAILCRVPISATNGHSAKTNGRNGSLTGTIPYVHMRMFVECCLLDTQQRCVSPSALSPALGKGYFYRVYFLSTWQNPALPGARYLDLDKHPTLGIIAVSSSACTVKLFCSGWRLASRQSSTL